ncbi:MAG: nickel-dependent lactate racemase [Armatimonadetes bacterium]|nr:nickel-dependent lactate racemase [Armatimonadota bacterium]MDW8122174.1 lactate racemase domain-containing protein [Armatimonadota bacterium]
MKGSGRVLETAVSEELIRFVERKEETFLFHYGEGFLFDHLPVGTRIIYPRPPLPPLEDWVAEIRKALCNPVGTDPLPALLKPGMKVTICFDDLSLPLPPMKRPDIRQMVAEEVLSILADRGVDDVHFIGAIGLHRPMTLEELRHQLGERIVKAFYPLRLYCHDAEDPTGLVFIGKTEKGEEVWLNRRVAESDLVIYININLSPMDGGHKSLVTGVTNYATLKHHHNAPTLLTSYYMDPDRSSLHRVLERQGRLIEEAVRHFQIETVVNSRTFPSPFGYLEKKEKDWTIWERMWATAVYRAGRMAPYELNTRIWQAMRAPYGMIGITAGAVEEVHSRTLSLLAEQQEVSVTGQSDIVVSGVPYLCPYNVNSVMNPILVFCLSLGYIFHLMSIGQPLLRPGGVLIFTHPLYERFHQRHHPSYITFYERVLTVTRDPLQMHKSFEEAFATDPTFIFRYRRDYAYHGVHPFYMWYWGSLGAQYAGKVIFVGADKKVAERIGVDVAASVSEAIEMAKDFVGNNSSVTYFHFPPIFSCRVLT